MTTLYLFLTSALLYIKPAIVFDEDGNIRPFGTGKYATVFPLWWWIFAFAIVSYLAVLSLSMKFTV
jgi:hypothetical protein